MRMSCTIIIAARHHPTSDLPRISRCTARASFEVFPYPRGATFTAMGRKQKRTSGDQARNRILLLALALGGRCSMARWHRLAEVLMRSRGERAVPRSQLEALARQWVSEKMVYLIPAHQALYEMPPYGAMLAMSNEPEADLLASWELLRYEYKGSFGSWSTTTDVRMGLVLRQPERVQRALWRIGPVTTKRQKEDAGWFLIETLGIPPKTEWIAVLGDYAAPYLNEMLEYAMMTLVGLGDEALAACDTSKTRLQLARYLCMTGRTAEARALPLTKRQVGEIELLAALWAGDFEAALQAGDAAIAAMPKSRKRRFFTDATGVLHALLRASAPSRWNEITPALDDAYRRDHHATEFGAIHMLCASVEHERNAENDLGWFEEAPRATWLETLAVGLVTAWLDGKGKWLRPRVQAMAEHARDQSFAPIARELDAIAARLDGNDAPEGSWVGRYRRREPWQMALDALERLANQPSDPPPKEKTKKKPKSYIGWCVSLSDERAVIEPRRLSARAKVGKKVSIDKMIDGAIADVTEHDRRVLRKSKTNRWGPRNTRFLDADALPVLVGHPHCIDSEGSPLMLSRGEPALRVDARDDHLVIRVDPPGLGRQRVCWTRGSGGSMVVFERTDELEKIIMAIGGVEVAVPQHASADVSRVVGALGGRVRVGADEGIELAGKLVESDSRPLVLLDWVAGELRGHVRSAPLGVDGPRFHTAEGGVTIAAVIEGTPVRTTRDHDEERARLLDLLERCPTLAGAYDQGELLTGDLELALDVLLELEDVGDEVLVGWPEGRRLETPKRRGVEEFRVRARESGDWLSVDAELAVDADTVLSFRELIAKRRGRFVKLDGDQIIVLSNALQERVDALEALHALNDADKTPPIVLPLIDQVSRGALELDAAAKRRLERVDQALQSRPRPPRGLRAQLRDYQREGYTWMARLADAGLGACLADDMGLGKTVQAIALLLARRKRGPALVLAPTSVAANWAHELSRFAPSMNPILFAAQRDVDPGPADVLICSYGVLVTERERLQELAFDTVVFDEAHYLKNPRTKRAKAARGLDAQFRLALTGTPIENHLVELWSLFECITPGLLGSAKRFESRFATPIANGDRQRARQLKTLVRPFLLRRTKTQVLDELPERTEVTIRVEPNPKEAAYYEALRRAAVDETADADSRMILLAHITRLRQAAVDPRIVDGPRGAKIDALLERLVGLAEEGHRTLVFTQFLGGIELVSAGLDRAGARYLTLDGSTPAAERTKRIAAFQDGEADVFVMSLKAGGVGVNLTAADYVMHLDPWWNPAVEEQATGRSHRIGQTNPVTVYRYVTVGTIEEKILELHREKRALADDLLDNMDRAKKLDLEQLRALL